jgi:hypothetical protein
MDRTGWHQSGVHKRACAELFNRSKANGDVYLETYEGNTAQ